MPILYDWYRVDSKSQEIIGITDTGQFRGNVIGIPEFERGATFQVDLRYYDFLEGAFRDPEGRIFTLGDPKPMYDRLLGNRAGRLLSEAIKRGYWQPWRRYDTRL